MHPKSRYEQPAVPHCIAEHRRKTDPATTKKQQQTAVKFLLEGDTNIVSEDVSRTGRYVRGGEGGVLSMCM